MCVGYSVGFASVWHRPVTVGSSTTTKNSEVESTLGWSLWYVLKTILPLVGYSVSSMATYGPGKCIEQNSCWATQRLYGKLQTCQFQNEQIVL